MSFNRRKLALFTSCGLAIAALIASCAAPSSPGPAAGILTPPLLTDHTPRTVGSLHNVVAYGSGFYSGSQPESAASFEELRAMGIKTIISVDGAVPDVEAAQTQGLRYIHLPIGYNGFDEHRTLELARASRDALAHGPVYLHCHHGKHRSAGAAAAVAVSLGWLTNQAAIDRMKVSGTSPAYQGLFACARAAEPIPAATLDSISGEFPEVSRPGTLVAAMVDADHAFEHLKLIEQAGWAIPNNHPDLVPAAEAGRLADLMRVQADSARDQGKSDSYVQAFRASADLATALEQLLASKLRPASGELSAAFKAVAKSCTDCHKAHRD